MPNMKTVTGVKFGDVLYLPDSGRFYALDRSGRLGLCFGSPVSFEQPNNDGNNTCVLVAFRNLVLETTELEKFHADHPGGEAPPRELWEPLLSKFEQVPFRGTVGRFIQEHPVGKYFVSYYVDYTEVTGHAVALADGSAFNIYGSSFGREIRVVWRIQ